VKLLGIPAHDWTLDGRYHLRDSWVVDSPGHRRTNGLPGGGNVADDVTFERIAPVLQVRDLDAALDRYRRLGFDVEPLTGGERYGFVERGRVSIHVLEWHAHDPGGNASHVYIYVSDADALHAEWAAAGVEGRLGHPHDTDYGLREFGYVDPDGNLHRVGSPLKGAHPG
jgi:hypothetical protein